MVAYLEKSDENAEFHQIVDFLSTCSINYALTVSPTIYASYIEQFWNTATSKTINYVKQIYVIVDGKAVVISESSVRSDLLFNDDDGGIDTGGSPRRQETMGGTPAHTRYKRVIEQPNEPPLSKGYTSGSGEGRMEQTFELMNNVPSTPHDSPLIGGYIPRSDEGRMKLDELITLCTKLSKQKTAQDRVISILKLRVKRLEKKRKARTPQPMKRRLFKGRFETSTNTSLDENTSKQGRSSDKTKPMFKDSDFDVGTARPEVSAATPSTPHTTTAIFDDEDVTMVMAQTLIKMKEVKAKEKGVEFRNVEEATRPVRSITTLQPLPRLNQKDKELAELDRAQIERQRQEEATNAALTEEFDEIQARIDADALFAAKLQLEERERERESSLPLKKEHNSCQLKGKTYEEIHELYERQQKRNQDFNYNWMQRKRSSEVRRRSRRKNCGVHTLFMDGTPMEINMLVEKKYPPIKELLEKVLDLQLEAREESTMAFELIKFIKSMLEE
ncbi:hypothetical protein Tco_1275861 [Tanacetum coccineum]